MAREIFSLYVAAMVRPESCNDVLMRMLTRPAWPFHPEFVPLDAEFFIVDSKPEPEDTELCERLIKSFRLATETSQDERGPIWGPIIKRAYKNMVSSMKSPKTLAEFLSTMFRSEAVEGMGTGQSYPNAMNEEGRKIWLMKLLDGLVSVAEMMGTVEVENYEQNPPAYGLRNGIIPLIESIESSLGINLSFPAVGGSYGFILDGRIVTMESPEHTEVAYRVVSLLKEKGLRSITEIGGGFGGTACWILRLLSPEVPSYRIYDLPHANVLQGYFLSKVLPAGTVSLYGEEPRAVQVLPIHQLSSAPTTDLLLNENSIPEVPKGSALRYMEWASESTKYLYSYNQECGMPIGSFSQNIVNSLTEKVGGFKRISRSRVWVRDGYVEEIYEVKL